MSNKDVTVQEIVAQREAKKAAEAKVRQDLLDRLQAEHNERQEALAREKAAKEKAAEKARQEKAEAKLEQRARRIYFANAAATEDGFRAAYPKLREELLIDDGKEAEKVRKQPHSVYRRW